MSYKGIGGGGYPYKKSDSSSGKGYSAVPPPSSLSQTRKGSQKSFVAPSSANQNQTTNSVNNSGLSKHGYSTMDAIYQFASSSSYAVGSKRKTNTEDDYFDDDDEIPQPVELAYIPAPGSPAANEKQKENGDSEDEDDPLDAFMANIEKQVEKETKGVNSDPIKDKNNKKGIRADIDDEDDEESYYRYMEENPNAGVAEEDSDLEIEYDEDGNPIAPPKKRDIDPLPPMDHSEIQYEPFEKNFYEPHDDIKALSRNKAEELRKTLGIRVTGASPPHPVSSFGHFGFDQNLMKLILKQEYTQPTPIQAQAIPAALSGRDLIGIAKTGSGKTAAFIWPMLLHIVDQRVLNEGEGPIALILAPTRELSLQIYNEVRKFGKAYKISCICIYGGGSKWEQTNALEEGAEVIVATPGRMIDMVKAKATNLRRVTYLVLDEADRMFNMGFEPQVRSICDHVRPDRQTLLFSATFKKRIEKLARDILTDPVKIVQGDVGEANKDVTQHVIVLNKPEHKWNWLLLKLVEFLSQGSVLIFVTKIFDADQLASNLIVKEIDCVLLHGDMDQADRNKVILKFKKKECDIMVATDVASRGLDIPHIRTVVNYDIARDIDTHTHRIGRTGRAGEKGTAYTLVTEKDKEFSGHLVRNLEGANQEVPKELMDLAMKSSWFRSSRFKSEKGKNLNVGGAGLGYRERPGFGNKTNSKSNPNPSNKPNFNSTTAPNSAVGPASNRYAAMKEAFKSQYTSQFRASSDRTWEKTVPETGVFAAPPPPPPPPGAGFKLTNASSNNTDETDEPKKRAKKSRWN